MCSLQLNVFYEFKKKVLLNHEQFSKIINEFIESRGIELFDTADKKTAMLTDSVQAEKIPKTESSKPKMGPKSRVPKQLPVEDNPATSDDERFLLQPVSDTKSDGYSIARRFSAEKPVKILNKSPAAVPIKLQKRVKPETQDDEADEFDRISRYLCEAEKNESESEQIAKLTSSHIKTEIFDSLEIQQDADDMEYFEEYYLEEAEFLESVADPASSIRNYESRNSPTFSAIYLEEDGTELALNDERSNITDKDSDFVVERLMTDGEFELEVSMMSSQTSKDLTWNR